MGQNYDYSLATLNNYKVNRPNEPEVIRQRLYDYQIYPTAGQVQLTFFALPIGQGLTSSTGAVAASAKTYADTNMEVGGQLPSPKAYLAESIEILFEPGSVSTANTFTHAPPNVFNAAASLAILAQVQDVNIIRISGWLEFYIGSKTYLYEAPLGVFPSKVWLGIDGMIGTAGTNAAPNEVGAIAAHWQGRPYYLDPPITLDSQQNFAVYMKWPAVVATPSGFNARIGVALDGALFRLSQ